MELRQQTPDCSDFDVVINGDDSPSFRVLLPEAIYGNGTTLEGGVHTIPGSWETAGTQTTGRFSGGDHLDVSVRLTTGTRELQVKLSLRNRGDTAIEDVAIDICTSVNHLPGEPGWCNRQFLPDPELDRSVQGRYWFEKVTPGRLFALTGNGWVGMHPCPEDPDAENVPIYSFEPSDEPTARACAAQSPDGDAWFFQAWDVPCQYCTPCPGNACMHLHPVVARRIGPNETATIRGLVGVHLGARSAVEAKVHAIQEAGGNADEE